MINVDLTATPYPALVGDPITYNVKVTNPLQCPVGGVIGFLFPLVPNDHFINKIEDDELRKRVSDAVDAFCAGGSIHDGVDHAVKCDIVSGELVCEFDAGAQSPDTVVALASTASGDEVTCQSSGTKITCRIPRRLVELGNQTAAQSNTSDALDLFPFKCNQVDGIFVCGSAFLGAGAMKMDEVQFTATQPGRFHSFVVTFATRSGGVCKTGILPSVPCHTDSDCFDPPGPVDPDCGSGICDGGKTGFGCDADGDCTVSGRCVVGRCVTGKLGAACTSNADCAATGTCVQCDSSGDGLLPGAACKNSFVIQGVQAPALSPWSLAGTAAGLVCIATVLLRSRRRG